MRARVSGVTFFFTLVTENRRPTGVECGAYDPLWGRDIEPDLPQRVGNTSSLRVEVLGLARARPNLRLFVLVSFC